MGLRIVAVTIGLGLDGDTSFQILDGDGDIWDDGSRCIGNGSSDIAERCLRHDGNRNRQCHEQQQNDGMRKLSVHVFDLPLS